MLTRNEQTAAVERAKNKLEAAHEELRNAQHALWEIETGGELDVAQTAGIYRREIIGIKRCLNAFANVLGELKCDLEDEPNFGR